MDDASGPPLNLIERPPAETAVRLRALGLDALVARRVMAERVREGRPTLGRVRGLAASRRAAVEAAVAVPRLEVIDRRVDPADGFAKYLLRLPDGPAVEAVRIPLLKPTPDGRPRFSVCLSSEAGCGMGCGFCRTGRLGLARRLEPWEIVAQALAIRDEAPGRVAGAVFMGQGEPFDNPDAVRIATDVLSHPDGLGLSRRAITVSTVGVVPEIRRFARERRRERLAISLVTADEARRRALVPLARRDGHDLASLRSALDEVVQATGRRVLVVLVLIGGVTTTEADARADVEFLQGLPCWIDLIDVNDPDGRYHPPDPDERERFVRALRETGHPIQVRYTGGKAIGAACGLLATTAEGGAPAPAGLTILPHPRPGAGPVSAGPLAR